MTSTATPAKIVAAARHGLGKPGPINTCVINGMQRFAHEAGAPYLTRLDGRPTASISEARTLAKGGRDGWTYHEGLQGLQPGDFPDWQRPSGIFHVTTAISVRRNAGGTVLAVQSIGSGGPSGKINWQPLAGEGWNVAAYFRGYWRAPLAKSGGKPKAKTVKHAAKYTDARRGEGLDSIAKRMKITEARIKSLNPQVKGPKFVVGLGDRIRYQ